MSGYLPDEVVGLSAFMYMHREDMWYAVVALRQSELSAHALSNEGIWLTNVLSWYLFCFSVHQR